MSKAERQILAIEKEMARDFNERKIDKILEHFDPDVVGFSSTRQDRLSGRRAMKRTFDYYLDVSSDMKFRIHDVDVRLYGDTAVATFTWTVEWGKGRPRHSINGRGSHVYVLRGGNWTIVHEHFSRAH